MVLLLVRLHVSGTCLCFITVRLDHLDPNRSQTQKMLLFCLQGGRFEPIVINGVMGCL